MVQVTGALRNAANENEQTALLLEHKVVGKLFAALKEYSQHRELVLNISRILSKLSLDQLCGMEMLKSDQAPVFFQLMGQYKEDNMILTRFAFVLGNLTTNYDEVRVKLCTELNAVPTLLDMAIGKLHVDKQSPGGKEA